MGSFDGAEVCELSGLYVLNGLVEEGLFPKELVGVYQDDGLAVLSRSNAFTGGRPHPKKSKLF